MNTADMTNQELYQWAEQRVVEDILDVYGSDHWIAFETDEVYIGAPYGDDRLNSLIGVLHEAMPDLSLISPTEVECYYNAATGNWQSFVQQDNVRHEVPAEYTLKVAKATGNLEALTFYLDKYYDGMFLPRDIRDHDVQWKQETFGLSGISAGKPMEPADLDSPER